MKKCIRFLNIKEHVKELHEKIKKYKATPNNCFDSHSNFVKNGVGGRFIYIFF